MGIDVLYQGILITILVLVSYFCGHYMEFGNWEMTDSTHGTTMALLTMSMAEIFHSINMRSQRGSVFKLGTHNKVLAWAAVGSLIATTVVCEVSVVAAAFEFSSVGIREYVLAIFLGICIIPLVELIKLIQRKKKGEEHKRDNEDSGKNL